MRRRQLLRQCGVGIAAVLAGCGQFVGQPDPPQTLNIDISQVVPVSSGWQLRLATEAVPVTESIPEVRLVAYTEAGELVCEKVIGELDGGTTEHQLSCSEFPAIISARTGLDCERVNVQIVYWDGTPEQRQRRISEEITGEEFVYQNTRWKCDESLPPERVLSTDN